MKKALFLDRDGILNKVVIRNGTVSSPWFLSEFEIMNEAIRVVEAAKALGYRFYFNNIIQKIKFFNPGPHSRF